MVRVRRGERASRKAAEKACRWALQPIVFDTVVMGEREAEGLDKGRPVGRI